LNLRTVTRWLAAGTFPERRTPTVRRRDSLFAPSAVTVQEHHRSVVSNGAALYRTLREHGYRGSAMTVRRELDRLRRLGAQSRRATIALSRPPTPAAASPARIAVPTVRQLVWLLCSDDAALPPEERAYVDLPALAELHRLALAFGQMLKTHHVDAFRPWLDAAQRSDLASFARGVECDYDAVLAAIVFRCVNPRSVPRHRPTTCAGVNRTIPERTTARGPPWRSGQSPTGTSTTPIETSIRDVARRLQCRRATLSCLPAVRSVRGPRSALGGSGITTFARSAICGGLKLEHCGVPALGR